jgi:palmitoyl-protein thioesterase
MQDRLGLQQLDKLGRLKFLAVDGDHVQFDEDWFIQNIVDKYLK